MATNVNPPSLPDMNDPEFHLARLYQEHDDNWFHSLKNSIKSFFEPPPPPLQTTSKPVPVKDIWGEYRYGKISGPASIGVHAVLIALLITASHFTYTHRAQIAQQLKQLYDPIDIAAYKPDVKPMGGGGGGGDRSPTPASKGVAPRFDKEQYTPPTVIIRNEHPKLAMDPTLIGPPDLKIPQPNMNVWGDPLTGVVGPPSNGPGSGGGIGSGRGGGVGSGDGAGLGPGSGGGFGGGAFRIGGGVTAPQLIYRVEPEYTEEARKAKYQGTVVLYAVVDPDGLVRQVRVVRSLGLGLDEKALEAVRQWKFKPGTKDGRPVPVVASIEVTFRLL